MRTKFIALIAAGLLLLNSVGFAAIDMRTANRQTSRIVGLLPASDAVITLDAKRALDGALPKIFQANQSMYDEIMAKIAEAETRTGIDFRKFEQVAVGVAYVKRSATETDYEPVAIASGDINAGALIAIAKLASNGTYRTETIGGRTVYIFSTKDLATKSSPVKVAVTNSKVAGSVGRAMDSLVKDIAVTAYDSRTLVMGTIERVTETLAGKSHVSSDLTSLLPAGNTVTSFAARTPDGISKILPLDNDQFGANIQSIQYVAGSFDVNTVGADLEILAHTKKTDQAQSLKDTLDGLQMLGKAFLGTSKSPDKQVYARMLKNVKIDIRGNDVTLSLVVPQADIDTLIAGIK